MQAKYSCPQNKYRASHYEQVSILLPKGTRDRWKALAKAEGLTLNRFVAKAVDLYTGEQTAFKTPGNPYL